MTLFMLIIAKKVKNIKNIDFLCVSNRFCNAFFSGTNVHSSFSRENEKKIKKLMK